jgi:hypothetical protein
MTSTHHLSVYTWRACRQPYALLPTRERSPGHSAVLVCGMIARFGTLPLSMQ